MKLGKLSKKILMTSLILSSIALVGCTTNNSTNKENNSSDNQITVQHKLGTTKLNSKPILSEEIQNFNHYYNDNRTYNDF